MKEEEREDKESVFHVLECVCMRSCSVPGDPLA